MGERRPMPTAQAEAIGRSRYDYARAWAVNAHHYEAQGLYRRLASLLTEHGVPHSLIDLGCGTGEGLAAMRAAMPPHARLWGLDENPACLAAATARLAPVERLAVRPAAADGYDLLYHPAETGGEAPVALIHSDLLRPDPGFAETIALAGPVDAMTLWFTGTHGAREDDRLIATHRLCSDELYGLAVELTGLGLAGDWLRPGGLFQLVGRAAHPDDATILTAFRARLLGLAEHLPLSLIALDLVPYTEPAGGGAMLVAQDRSSAPPARTVAVSAIFRRDS
ncbi:class I SAM-dependent methyltransferase [Sphingobium xenophagum]|nr:class I SAM-dependent methyltransferase [Sphingobium xenophagum]